MEQLLNFDTDLLMWVNSHHCTVLDWTMWTASQVWSWVIIILLVFGLFTFRREPRRWWVVLLALGFGILLSDRISVMAFKDVFQRLRPCHVIDNLHMFRTGCAGQYGFVSSHATNIFAIVTFFIMRYASKWSQWATSTSRLHRWLTVILLVIWAVVVCYSRPYLGKHYPGDVVCGALLGTFIGLFVWWVTKRIEARSMLAKKN